MSVVFPLRDGEDEMSWQERALCAQTDPESFFPEKGGSTREAKRVCTGCEVARRVPGVRARARRAVRHLGRPVRARAAPAEEAGRLTEAAGDRPRPVTYRGGPVGPLLIVRAASAGRASDRSA